MEKVAIGALAALAVCFAAFAAAGRRGELWLAAAVCGAVALVLAVT